MLHPINSSIARPRLRARTLFYILFALIALSAITVPGVSSRAALRFDRPAPHATLMQQLYNQLPSIWKTGGVVLVREVSGREMARLVEEDEGDRAHGDDQYGDIQAYYESPDDSATGQPTITLRNDLDTALTSLVFTHEYGHFVWDNKLTDDDRDAYIDLWNRQKRAHHLVSDYAGASVDEGFAEAFAHYLRKPAMLKQRDFASYRFVANLLNREPQKN